MSDVGVTHLLLEWSKGDREAFGRLVPLVQQSLHEIARAHLRRERDDHTLEPSALVNELYLRLVDQRAVTFRDRHHFYGVAAQVMRHVLVDHARKRLSDKRGGGMTRVTLNDQIPGQTPVDVLALDAAMTELARVHPDHVKVVELRFFAGMTIEETAEEMETSPATVKRDWTFARAWLRRALEARPRVSAL